MDIRNATQVEPIIEHNGSTPVWYLVSPGSRREVTAGASLELINEFQVPKDCAVAAHVHPTHEFYYVLQGCGTMMVDGEAARVGVGDLIYIPPEAEHSLHADSGETMRCFCFALATPGAGRIDYTTH